MIRRISTYVRGEGGSVLYLVALAIFMLMGMVALAVDLGRLLAARTEAQHVADASALAGAAAFIYVNNPTQQEATARQWAKDYAAQNSVHGTPITLRDMDIDVFTVERKVGVRVRRDQDWGGPIPTVFARVFGADEVDVGTYAAAEASLLASNVSCPLPIVVPDDWLDGSLGPNPGPEYDPDEGDIYKPPFVEQYPGGPAVLDNNNQPILSDPYYGFLTEQRLGDYIVLKPSQGGSTDTEGRLVPGFWDVWLPEPFSGVPPIRTRILDCVQNEELEATADMWAEKGNMQTLADTFQELIELFPHEEWSDTCNCPVSTVDKEPIRSMRYRAVPYLDPRFFTKQGSGPHFQVAGFGGMWVEEVRNELDDSGKGQRNVYARILKAPGNLGDQPGAGPFVLALRLVN